MKLLGIGLVLLSGTSMGVIFNQIQKTRIKELVLLQQFMSYLKNEINYAMTPITEAIDLVCAKDNNVIHDFFTALNNKLKSINQGEMDPIDNCVIEELLYTSCLQREDLKEMLLFVKHLGSRDKESQISDIELMMSNLETHIHKLKADDHKNAKLYQSMGVMIGALVIIISL